MSICLLPHQLVCVQLLEWILLRLGVGPLLHSGVLDHEYGAAILLGHLNALLEHLELLLRHGDRVLEISSCLFIVPSLLLVFDCLAAPIILECGNHRIEEVSLQVLAYIKLELL